ncbi:waprin-Thr1-like [Cephus cinctus]|uniref:Waprin-Thr1-like n=1 Tax=Cephus cinctus TaxID=211228 RepID=A0AAJ7BML8_CEPCN|nr:waprin-Thr1-like [Cephus cinctus]
MNVKVTFIILSVLLVATLAQVSHKEGNCPLRNSVSKCNPSCQSDHQCNFNQKCCPNKCGHSSCVTPSAVNTGSDGGYKGSNKDSAVYCAGVRCSAFEKCQLDRTTKREKCVRA